MVTRAVSASRLLTPLAVLVPILATPLLALWIAPTSWAGALLVLVAGLTAISVAGHLTYGRRRSVLSAVLTWVILIVSFPVFLGISINTSICGKNIAASWEWLPPAAALLAYFAVGVWGLSAHRASWAAPLGYAVGFVVLVLLLASVPGTPGICET
jgi:hypothetical protein